MIEKHLAFVMEINSISTFGMKIQTTEKKRWFALYKMA